MTVVDAAAAGGAAAPPPRTKLVNSAPPAVQQHQREATAELYRAAAVADGIPPRPSEHFPPGDALLARLDADAGLRAFEKHLAGLRHPCELLPRGGWATGDAACRAGLDLRLYHRAAAAGERWGTLEGALRLGEAASIGNGCWMSAHGGAVETALDEATAELAKMEWAPVLSTVEAHFRIRRPVPLHTSLAVRCRVREQRGVRMWVEGAIAAEGEGEDGADAVLATCEATLVDLKHWL